MKKIIVTSLLLFSASIGASPQIIAHRGGTADAPENTLPAIKLALQNQAQAIWITVQLSRDGVPVLYRPRRLWLLRKTLRSHTTWSFYREPRNSAWCAAFT
jgi:glycerophosphoryl diester phosphodiesterase